MARVELNGLGLEVTRVGGRDGVPLLVLHGFTGTAEELLAPARTFAKACVGVDLIGHGRSDAPADLSRYAFEAALADLALLLDHLQLPQVDLWGYSLGARLALGFALAHPGRVRRLVLESGSPGLQTEVEREARRRDDSELAVFIEREGIAAFVARWEKLPLFAGEDPAASRAVRLAQRPHGLASSLRGMGTGAQPSYWPRLGALEAPALLVTGARDVKFDALAARMSSMMPRARRAVVSGAGHAVHRERPAEAAAAIAEFLRSP